MLGGTVFAAVWASLVSKDGEGSSTRDFQSTPGGCCQALVDGLQSRSAPPANAHTNRQLQKLTSPTRFS
eukprot:2652877-Amphidinium_carterae.1